MKEFQTLFAGNMSLVGRMISSYSGCQGRSFQAGWVPFWETSRNISAATSMEIHLNAIEDWSVVKMVIWQVRGCGFSNEDSTSLIRVSICDIQTLLVILNYFWKQPSNIHCDKVKGTAAQNSSKMRVRQYSEKFHAQLMLALKRCMTFTAMWG